MEEGKLEDLKGRKNLLVSFGGINQKLGIPVFEFYKSISHIDCDKIFLRDFSQAWYQKGIDDEIDYIDKLISYLSEAIGGNYSKVCFLGNSMGGYAAILFGTILNVNTAISFAPQTYIDLPNKIVNLDYRWLSQILKIYSFNGKKAEYFDLKKYLSNAKEYRTEVHVYYSNQYRLDMNHAQRLAGLRNIHLHPVSEGGHRIVKTIRDTGELKLILESVFE